MADKPGDVSKSWPPPMFVQIAGTNGDLYALDETGAVWRFRAATSGQQDRFVPDHWEQLSDQRGKPPARKRA